MRCFPKAVKCDSWDDTYRPSWKLTVWNTDWNLYSLEGYLALHFGEGRGGGKAVCFLADKAVRCPVMLISAGAVVPRAWLCEPRERRARTSAGSWYPYPERFPRQGCPCWGSLRPCSWTAQAGKSLQPSQPTEPPRWTLSRATSADMGWGDSSARGRGKTTTPSSTSGQWRKWGGKILPSFFAWHHWFSPWLHAAGSSRASGCHRICQGQGLIPAPTEEKGFKQ